MASLPRGEGTPRRLRLHRARPGRSPPRGGGAVAHEHRASSCWAHLSPPRGGATPCRPHSGCPPHTSLPHGEGAPGGLDGNGRPGAALSPRGEGTGSRTGIAWHASHPARRTHASAALRGPTRTASITHELWRHSVINLRRRLRKPDRPIAPAQGDASAPATRRPAFFPATTPLRMCRPKLARRRAPEAPPCTYGEA